MTAHDGSDDLLLSDAERLHALTALGDHYAAGRLDDPEFHARSGDASVARRVSDLVPLFRDLPGGSPIRATSAGTEIVPVDRPGPPAERGPEEDRRELEDLHRRGKIVESLDGVVLGVTLVAFLVLQIIVGWQYAWIVWPSLALTLGIPRAILHFTDADEELYDELKESTEKEREKRLRAASKRIRELGDGSERPAN